jgi:NAD(P)-dependent dehydrogenase (short-subunit alcohol dehydrogenase family)
MSVSIETTEVPTAPNTSQPILLGQKARMPEFSLAGKVVCVSGAGRGLGLTQAEALLEAGAKVYALDRLEEPAADFSEIQKRAKELGTELHYRRIDVRDTELLNSVVEDIANTEGRMDGLVAAAGIQQETPALEYTAKDSNTILEVNVTGVFMTAQAVAKQMIRFGNGGSIALIASMSGTIANRVRFQPPNLVFLGLHLVPPTIPALASLGISCSTRTRIIPRIRAIPLTAKTNFQIRVSSAPPTMPARPQ